MTESFFQSGFQAEHHKVHAFPFERIGQGTPHDLPALTKQGVGAALGGVGAQEAVEFQFLADGAHQGEPEGGQGKNEEELFATQVAPDFGV